MASDMSAVISVQLSCLEYIYIRIAELTKLADCQVPHVIVIVGSLSQTPTGSLLSAEHQLIFSVFHVSQSDFQLLPPRVFRVFVDNFRHSVGLVAACREQRLSSFNGLNASDVLGEKCREHNCRSFGSCLCLQALSHSFLLSFSTVKLLSLISLLFLTLNQKLRPNKRQRGCFSFCFFLFFLILSVLWAVRNSSFITSATCLIRTFLGH